MFDQFWGPLFWAECKPLEGAEDLFFFGYCSFKKGTISRPHLCNATRDDLKPVCN